MRPRTPFCTASSIMEIAGRERVNGTLLDAFLNQELVSSLGDSGRGARSEEPTGDRFAQLFLQGANVTSGQTVRGKNTAETRPLRQRTCLRPRRTSKNAEEHG